MKSEKIKETVKSLEEINDHVKKLDPAIRSGAFDVLAKVYFGKIKKEQDEDDEDNDEETLSDDADTFFNKYNHEKAADNILLIAAWLYSQYGKYPITKSELDSTASNCGLTIPDRSDITMRQATRKGKSLFTKSGKGWQLTVSGEHFLRATYKVKKGNKSRKSEAE
jgi:hypothetical protein